MCNKPEPISNQPSCVCVCVCVCPWLTEPKIEPMYSLEGVPVVDVACCVICVCVCAVCVRLCTRTHAFFYDPALGVTTMCPDLFFCMRTCTLCTYVYVHTYIHALGGPDPISICANRVLSTQSFSAPMHVRQRYSCWWHTMLLPHHS